MQKQGILQGLLFADELLERSFVVIFGIFPLSVADIIIFRFFDLFTQIDVRLFRLLLVQGLGLGNLRFPFVVIVYFIFQYRVLHEFVLHKGIQLLRIEL